MGKNHYFFKLSHHDQNSQNSNEEIEKRNNIISTIAPRQKIYTFLNYSNFHKALINIDYILGFKISPKRKSKPCQSSQFL